MLRNEISQTIHKEYIPTIEEAVALIDIWLKWYHQLPHVNGKTVEAFNVMKGQG
jgi:hypothetical protein